MPYKRTLDDKRKNYIMFILITALSLFYHYPHLAKDLIGIHVWRQTQTQWNIINFYLYDFNILNPRVCVFDENGSNIYRYEFPIMQWTIALFMKLLGDSIVVTRMCVFIIGSFSVLGMYRILKLLSSHTFGSWLGACAFAFSPLFFYYTINPLPDNLALLGGIWFLYYFLKYYHANQLKYIYYSAAYLLLCVFAKLPFIILAAGVSVYVFSNLKRKRTYEIILIYTLFLLPALAWYLWVIPGWGGNGVLYGIFENEISAKEYNRIIEYHKTTMFPKILLNDPSTYIFFIGVLFALFYEKYKKKVFWILFVSLMACVTYLLLELNMINTVHDYYMMPFLPFLFIIVGYGLICLWRSNIVLKIATLVLMQQIIVVTNDQTKKIWTIESSYTNPYIFTCREVLRNAVPDSARCIIFNDASPYVFPYMFNKMGYVFNRETYSAEELETMILKNHVRYMYSDDRIIDTIPALQPYFKRKVIECGDIKVFELQIPADFSTVSQD